MIYYTIYYLIDCIYFFSNRSSNSWKAITYRPGAGDGGRSARGSENHVSSSCGKRRTGSLPVEKREEVGCALSGREAAEPPHCTSSHSHSTCQRKWRLVPLLLQK